MDSNFSQLIEAGATIVTPTKRLSRHLSYQYAQEKIKKKKKTSWITPDFLPWEGWCKNIFDKLLFSTIAKISSGSDKSLKEFAI